MKRFLWVLAILICMAAFAGCDDIQDKDDGLKIVTTIFPEYDWARRIIGDIHDPTQPVQFSLLAEGGVDIHSFQPTSQQIADIYDCDIFIWTGGASEAWVAPLLQNDENNTSRVTIDLMSLLAEEEKITEYAKHHNTDSDHQHGEVTDEHLWLSLRYAVRYCEAITEALCEKDPTRAERYRENCRAYVAELTALDQEYQAVIAAASTKTLLFADRFPFAYLAHDYGLVCYAAFPGCSTDSEASFETVAYLTDVLEAQGLSTIVLTETGTEDLAHTIARSAGRTDVHIVALHSMQSLTPKDGETLSYLDIMKHNLEALRIALCS